MRIQRHTNPLDALLDRFHLSRHAVGWLFAGVLLFFSFLKLPATGIMDSPPQSWEAVVAYAVPHHFQWGTDIVYTYGPLAFLSLDYYWGFNFVPILLWSLAFSLVLTVVLLRFLRRVAMPVRITFCLLLTLLTVPRDADLGTDPIYLFAITLYGLACLPSERPGMAKQFILGAMLGLLALFKFTFCVFSLFTLLIIVVAYLSGRQFRPAALVAGSAAISFLAAWMLAGQSFGHIIPWFRYNWQIVSGYAPAMSLPPSFSQLAAGLLIALCLGVLLLAYWCKCPKGLPRTLKLGFLVAGSFLAWKEGFVRADSYHRIVFPFYATMLVAFLPALFWPHKTNRPAFPGLAAVVLIGVPSIIFFQGSEFLNAIRTGAVPRLMDTVTALFAPTRYHRQLEEQLESRRREILLPGILAITGQASLGVLASDQDVAILNGFNYRPHPVFQNFSAYTPELQRLNAGFFRYPQAPDYVLWRYGTLPNRFQTLDDGQIILIMLSSYTPVFIEKGFVLWKRTTSPDAQFRLVDPQEVMAAPGEWIPLPPDPAWLRIDWHQTWAQSIKEFFYQASLPMIEARLTDGKKGVWCLVPGNARSGFIINPLLDSGPDLVLPFMKPTAPWRVVAIRVFSNQGYFDGPVRFTIEKIEGVRVFDREFNTTNSAVAPSS